MHTAYFYLPEAQEPSICMKIVRARRDGGLNTDKVKTPLIPCKQTLFAISKVKKLLVSYRGEEVEVCVGGKR